jgi:hypothetical protein
MSTNFFRGLKFAIPLSLILWVILIAVARAADAPLATTQGANGYSTEAEAVQAALIIAAQQSAELEQAGGVAFKDGQYYPTNAVSNLDPRHFAIRIQFAGKLVAIYHTHPGKDGTADAFSRDDRAVAAQLHVHSYIRAVASGGVYLLADDRVTQLGGHSLCHGMECKDYYALARRQVAALYGQVRP